MSQQFYSIQVSDLVKTTPYCSVVSFDIPEDLKKEFEYKQGQYLTLKANINGEEVRRSYSLCSSPLDYKWQVAVKKIEDGRFSTYVNDVLQVGDTLEVMAPNGRFYTEVDSTKSKNYIAFAAGSGITPINSIIKTHLHSEPNSTFKLFYLNQSVQSMILREEIEGLKNQYLGRYELYHFLTKEMRDAPLFNGRFTEEKLKTIHDKIVDFNTVDEFFICGPTEMIFLIRDFLYAAGVDESKVHFELFGTPTGGKKKKTLDTNNKDVSNVSIITNGVQVSFDMTQNGENILDAALRNNADLPFACKGGVCCTCRAKLIEGEAPMEVNYALETEEVEQGYTLTCQAIPKSSKIVVDFDS